MCRGRPNAIASAGSDANVGASDATRVQASELRPDGG
jgi:hypothetical protein